MKEHDLSAHQAQALRLLRAEARRDLYASAVGDFWITYSGDEKYAPWTRAEVMPMVEAGLLVMRYPDCFTLPSSLQAIPSRWRGEA